MAAETLSGQPDISDNFRRFLATCQPQQVQEILDILKNRQIVSRRNSAQQIHPQVHGSSIANAPVDALHQLCGTDKVKKRKKGLNATPKLGSKSLKTHRRPLNSFMAFRTYYGQIFSSIQQKYVSNAIRQLWDADPFKTKWTIVASAYTMIRDSVDGKAGSLSVFLDIVCPVIGCINPAEYMTAMGWDFRVTPTGTELRRIFEPYFAAFEDKFKVLTWTALEVVRIAVDARFAPELCIENVLSPHFGSSKAFLNMAVEQNNKGPQRLEGFSVKSEAAGYNTHDDHGHLRHNHFTDSLGHPDGADHEHEHYSSKSMTSIVAMPENPAEHVFLGYDYTSVWNEVAAQPDFKNFMTDDMLREHVNNFETFECFDTAGIPRDAANPKVVGNCMVLDPVADAAFQELDDFDSLFQPGGEGVSSLDLSGFLDVDLDTNSIDINSGIDPKLLDDN